MSTSMACSKLKGKSETGFAFGIRLSSCAINYFVGSLGIQCIRPSDMAPVNEARLATRNGQ